MMNGGLALVCWSFLRKMSVKRTQSSDYSLHSNSDCHQLFSGFLDVPEETPLVLVDPAMVMM